MKKIFNKYKEFILAFIIPIIIILLIYIIIGIYPFGDNVVAFIDGYSQYPGILSNFINTIKQGDSIFYSLKGLLGFNSYASMIYYTFNITNILALLFKNIMTFYNFIVPIKIGISSLTMYLFLNYNHKSKSNYIFSISYALCAYNVLYYFNYMWIDSIMIFPLVILGLDKIFKEDKYKLYLITLSLTILFNFYIGYMICIFSVIYFIYKSIINGFNKKRIIKYLLYSILSGLICSFALIPVVLELLNGKAELISEFANNYFQFDLDFLNIFYKFTFSSLSNGDLEFGTPNVYVGIFSFINALLYFFNKNIPLKERIASLSVFIFFLLSVSFNFLDYFWHMLSMPIYYPVRYSFIISFFTIYLAFKNYINFDKKNLKFNIIFYLGIIILTLIGFYTARNLESTESTNLLAKIIYLIITYIFIIYYVIIQNHKDFKKYIIVILIIELSFNTFLSFKNIGNTNKHSTYTNLYNYNETNLNLINDQSLYRIGIYDKPTLNNGLLLGYNELSYFSSVRNNKIFNYLENILGFNITNTSSNKYYYNNVIANSLLGIKYIITPNDLTYYEKINDNIYLNNDSTSFGFMTTKDILNLKDEGNYIDNLNNLVKTINGNNKNIIKEIEPIYQTIDCNEKTNICIFSGNELYIEYTYTATTKEFIFINDNNYKNNEYTTYLNDKEVFIENKEFILLNEGDNIKFTIYANEKSSDKNIKVCLINYDIYEEYITNINLNKLDINNYKSDSNFSGTINVQENGLLYTSISNDNGWKIYVDGELTEPISIYDAVIGLELESGYHTIEFKYFPPGLKSGIAISLCTVIILIILNKNKYRLK